MELLSDLWDKTTDAFTAVSEGVSEGLVRLFGNSNERQIRRMRPSSRGSTSSSRRCRPSPTTSCRPRPPSSATAWRQGETLDDLLPEAFAACREAGRRFLEHAALRRAAHRRHGPARRQHRRNGHRRRQDARRHPARLPQRARRQGRPRRHGQRLPRPPRHRMDGPALSWAWA